MAEVKSAADILRDGLRDHLDPMGGGDSDGGSMDMDPALWSDMLTRWLAMAASSPFTVAQVLIQTQYLSKERASLAQVTKTRRRRRSQFQHTHFTATDSDDEQEEEEEEEEEEEDGDEHDRDRNLLRDEPKSVDAMGYIMETDRPEWELPPLYGGIQTTVHDVMQFQPEGFWSLFKGLTPAWMFEYGRKRLAVVLEDRMNEALDLYDPSVVPLEHQESFAANFITMVVSHVVASTLLSPLELFQVRYVVQSRSKPTYTSLWPSVQRISGERSSPLQPDTFQHRCAALYPHLGLTVTYHTLCSLFRDGVQLVLQRGLRLSIHRYPWLYGLGLFGMFTLEYMLLSPLQTIRRRLQAQPASMRNSSNTPVSFYRCTSVSKIAYSGVWNCFYRTVTEECAFKVNKKDRKAVVKLKMWFGGWAQLYRGFWYQTTVNFMMSVLGVLMVWNGDDGDHFYF